MRPSLLTSIFSLHSDIKFPSSSEHHFFQPVRNSSDCTYFDRAALMLHSPCEFLHLSTLGHCSLLSRFRAIYAICYFFNFLNHRPFSLKQSLALLNLKSGRINEIPTARHHSAFHSTLPGPLVPQCRFQPTQQQTSLEQLDTRPRRVQGIHPLDFVPGFRSKL